MRSMKTSGGLTRGRGMSEIQRLTWVMAMSACAEINLSMQNLTGSSFHTSDQHTSGVPHKEATRARMERDNKDLQKIIGFLIQRDPFCGDPSLKNIATGVVAEDGVNCEKAKKVGDLVVKKMAGQDALEHSFQKKDQVKTLASKTSISLKDGTIQIDPQLLFQRLSVLATSGQYDNPASFFEYEMSSYPAALFDTSLLPRKADKPALADALWKITQNVQTTCPKEAHYVLDGGALIHRVVWPRGSTYDEVCSLYVQYVQRRYGSPTVVFDGYGNGPSTKDCTHQRRGSAFSPPVLFQSDMIVSLKKQDFLANEENKKKFINLLSTKLLNAGCNVIQAPDDADLLIVKAAVESAKSTSTVLIGDDTDLLVLMIYHGDINGKDLFFKPEPRQRSLRATSRVWNVKETKAALGPDLCNNILFIHALLGCDTTSRIHGLGKAIGVKKFTTDAFFRDQARLFSGNANDVNKEDVIEAGERALVCLYNGDKDESLNTLRYSRFCQKVSAGNAVLQPENLPPTSAAASYHSQRVFLQVQQWKGIELSPLEWGWRLKNGTLTTERTSLPPAHSSLLEMIRCGCKGDCRNKRCSCRKNNLPCSAACQCRGVSCTNAPESDITEEDAIVEL